MSYFNHAYKKTMLLTDGVIVNTALNSTSLTAGQIAICDASTYGVVSAVPNDFLLVQGNYNKTAALTNANKLSLDAIGGNKLHGGYAASVKSKLIKSKYVTALWKEEFEAQTAPTAVIKVNNGCYSCNNHAQLRIDLKGERVMRALNRNFYHVIDSTKCCTGGDNNGNPVALTAVEIMDDFAAQINEHPIMSNFISAIASGTNPAALTITLKEDDETEFGDCSLDTRDWYNTQPLTMILTEVDNEGDACVTGCIKLENNTTDLPAEGLTTIVEQDYVSGETVLRDILMDSRYRQEGGWNQGNRDSARFREIQKSDKLLAAVNRSGMYSVYYLQHSVPRFNNPTGVFDNDQYVVCVAVESTRTTDKTAMDTLWGNIATKTGLTVETPGAVV